MPGGKNKISSKSHTSYWGWLVVASAFIGNFFSAGLGFYSFNAFLQPLCQVHNWSRTAVNIAPSLGSLIGIFVQLLYGFLVVKYGPRILTIIGAIFAGVSFTLMGRTESLLGFYLFAVILFFANGAMNGIVANTAVSNWFERYRGRALGIATAGISISGAIIPPLALLLYQKLGLENAFLILGLSALILVSGTALAFLRNRPEQYGLAPDGLSSEEYKKINSSSDSSPDSFWSLKALLKFPTFWKLGLGYGLLMMGVVGVMVQLKPRFSDMGFSDQRAMAMMAITALMGGAGKYFWGRLCDRFEEKKVVLGLGLFQIAGFFLIIFGKSLWSLILFIFLFGLGMGGTLSTFPIIVASYFGRENFAGVLKYLTIFMTLQSLGYIIMGRSFDLTGSYNSAYYIFIVLDLIALVLILSSRRPKTSVKFR